MPDSQSTAANRFLTRFAAIALAAGLAGGAPRAMAGTGDADQQSKPAGIAISRTDYKQQLKRDQAVAISNPFGNVSVRFGGFEHLAETHAVLQEPAGAAHIEIKSKMLADGSYQIAAEIPGGGLAVEGQRVDLSLLLPEGHALAIRTDRGGVDVRGVHGNVDVNSIAGDIALRGIRGVIRAETGGGTIQASLGTAPRGAEQRLSTTTGEIQVGLDDNFDGELELATSALFATDYSLDVIRHPGEEPNKIAHALIGARASKLSLLSRRGQISLLRRAPFSAPGAPPSAAGAERDEQEQEESDSD